MKPVFSNVRSSRRAVLGARSQSLALSARFVLPRSQIVASRASARSTVRVDASANFGLPLIPSDCYWLEFKCHLVEFLGMGDDRCCHASAVEVEENYMIVLNGKGTIADVVALADRGEKVSISAGVLAA